MKNKILLLIMFLNVCFVYSESAPNLNDILFNGDWYLFENGIEKSPNLTIKFRQDKSFGTTSAQGESLSVLKGDFSLVDNQTMKLSYIIYSGYDMKPLGSYQDVDDIIKKLGKTEAVAKIKMLNGVNYSLVIELSNGVILASRKYKIKEGLKKDLNGISVITMGGRSAVTTENLKIRTKPSVDSDYIEYKGGMDGNYPYYPKDYHLSVYARTENKVKVGEWNNYWYYVELEADTSEMKTGWVWVFGEFVKFLD